MADRKGTSFVLWRPRNTEPAPKLVIGKLVPGNPASFAEERQLELRPVDGEPDLWEIPADECGLDDGEVYHYWFEVTDSNPYKNTPARIRCTDPTAWTVDWRLKAPLLPAPYTPDDQDPAGVVMYRDGQLVACDPGGETPDWEGDAPLDALPANNRLVIYELPTSWARRLDEGGSEIAAGTFRDVISLIERDAPAATFADVAALAAGRAQLEDLGVSALELLPPADSWTDRGWGYATSNYFAADFDLGFPRSYGSPTATKDLADLVKACHRHGIRVIDDMVMAFATRYSYQNINYLDFHVQVGTGDPEEYNQGTKREAFGGDLFKYNYWVTGYDPVSGVTTELVPARLLMKLYLERWMADFRIDGVRMDSVVNIANWDFVGEFKDRARELWHDRYAAQGNDPAGGDERFIVVGEELAVPIDLVRQNRLDGLWNEHFKRLVRSAILGQNDEGETSFEWTVRKLVDCRLFGFSDGAQAVNYVTSHDVEGFRNERLYNFLQNNGVIDAAPRIKLAFVCLLTAVGIPMILAGEEFADQHDLAVTDPGKEVDPVNYDRMDDPWRREIFEYVARLVKLRTSHPALARNDTSFIHSDFSEGKRVVVWQRGQSDGEGVVVVVANFSDWGTPYSQEPGAEYVIPGWPAAPSGKRWREVTQEREVPLEWAGREPLYPWEAKVYVLEG